MGQLSLAFTEPPDDRTRVMLPDGSVGVLCSHQGERLLVFVDGWHVWVPTDECEEVDHG